MRNCRPGKKHVHVLLQHNQNAYFKYNVVILGGRWTFRRAVLQICLFFTTPRNKYQRILYKEDQFQILFIIKIIELTWLNLDYF